MGPLYITLVIILVAACLAMITAILLQKKRDAGFSGQVTGQATSDSSHFDKTKGRTREGKLEKYTKILAPIFMGLALIISLIHYL